MDDRFTKSKICHSLNIVVNENCHFMVSPHYFINTNIDNLTRFYMQHMLVCVFSNWMCLPTIGGKNHNAIRGYFWSVGCFGVRPIAICDRISDCILVDRIDILCVHRGCALSYALLMHLSKRISYNKFHIHTSVCSCDSFYVHLRSSLMTIFFRINHIRSPLLH